jgi:hypothetical protein
MFQRIFPLVIPTYCRARAWRNGSTIGVACLALMCAVLLVPLASAQAQSVVNEDFEDGQYSGNATSMQVPPKIMDEGGNNFLRITASSGDKSSIPSSIPQRTRSTIQFTTTSTKMPLITDANRRQTYSADIRVRMNNANAGASIFEMYQFATGDSESYGEPNGTGPAARFLWEKGNHLIFEHRYDNERKIDKYDFGALTSGRWYNVQLKAVWSADPSVGRFEVYLDGNRRFTITGKPAAMGPKSDHLPAVKLGLYGDYLAGSTIDIDDLHINPTGSAPEPVPVAKMTINAGGAQYVGADGTSYASDAGYSGGRTYTTTAAIAGTADDRLYQSERYGDFSYAIPVANGDYLVTLKFAEIYWSQVGQRVFNVSMEGKVVLSNLDLVAKVGPKAAYDVTLPITVTDGVLTIGFQSVVNNAKVSAIKVEPESVKSVSISAPTSVRLVSGQ